MNSISSKSSIHSNSLQEKDVLLKWISKRIKLQYRDISEEEENNQLTDDFRVRSFSEHLPRERKYDSSTISAKKRFIKMIEYNNQESRGSAFLNWLGNNKKGFTSNLTRKNSDDSAYNTESEGSQYGYDHHKRRGSYYGLPYGYNSRFPPIYGSENGTPRQRAYLSPELASIHRYSLSPRPAPLRSTMSDSEVHKHKARFARDQLKDTKLTKKVIKGNWVVEDEKSPFGASKALERIQKKKDIQVPAFDEYKKFTGVEQSESENEQEEVRKKKKHKKKHKSKERRRTVSASELKTTSDTETIEKKSKSDKSSDEQESETKSKTDKTPDEQDPVDEQKSTENKSKTDKVPEIDPEIDLPVKEDENNDISSSDKKKKKNKKKKKKDKFKEEEESFDTKEKETVPCDTKDIQTESCDTKDRETESCDTKTTEKQENISEEKLDDSESQEVLKSKKKKKDKSKKKKKKKDKDKDRLSDSESKPEDNTPNSANINDMTKDEVNQEMRPTSSASSIMDNVDDYLFQKIQRKQTKDGISKKEFGKLLNKYLEKKFSQTNEKDEEQNIEEKVAAIVEGSKKDKEHISNLRKAEQDKVSDKLQKKLEAKKKKKEKKKKEKEENKEEKGEENE